MKTVSGRVISSKPVSLSKAARSLAKFVSSDNGASPAFAAYLKRASASFDELVQLRKELKGSGSEFKGKKKHFPDGMITDDTVNSVKKSSENGLISEERHGASDRTKQTSEGNLSRNVAGDLDAMGVNGVNNEIERQDGGKGTKKKKKKDKGQREESDGASKTEKPEQSCPLSQEDANGEGTDIVENGSSERKRHNKSKKGKDHEKESSGITDPNDGGNGKKESRKRKHKGSND